MTEAQGRGSDLGLALRTAHESMKRRGVIIILSDFKMGSFWKELSLVAKHHDVVASACNDPIDTEFPEGGLIELIDPETDQVVLGFGNSRAFRREYTISGRSRGSTGNGSAPGAASPCSR